MFYVWELLGSNQYLNTRFSNPYFHSEKNKIEYDYNITEANQKDSYERSKTGILERDSAFKAKLNFQLLTMNLLLLIKIIQAGKDKKKEKEKHETRTYRKRK